MLQVDVVTIFPEMFAAAFGVSIIKRAQERGRLRISAHDLRAYTHDQRGTVDDRPYGGGPGMVMKPEPIFEAVEDLKRSCAATRRRTRGAPPHQGRRAQCRGRRCQTVLMSPSGEQFSTDLAKALSGLDHLVIICGHYEGVDERVRLALADRTVSIGDYVLTGGELPAMVMIDGLARFIPGVIGHEQATGEESFSAGWLEYPQYTRPPVFRKLAVPDVLLSGDHERIAAWRTQQSVATTLAARPDLVVSNGPAQRRHQR